MFDDHPGPVTSLTFSPDGHILATGNSGNTVRIWEVISGLMRAALTGHTGPVWWMAFSPDARILATGSYDHTVRLWNVALPDVAAAINKICQSVIDRDLTPQEWSVYLSRAQPSAPTCPT